MVEDEAGKTGPDAEEFELDSKDKEARESL